MITPNGGVFGRNPKFNNVTVDGNLTVNGDIALGDDIVVADSLTVQGTEAATSTTTGALRVAGGISTQDGLYTGSDAVINGARVGIGSAGLRNTVLGVSAGRQRSRRCDQHWRPACRRWRRSRSGSRDK